MIDREALEKVAPKHFEGMASPSGVSLVLHLFGGEAYTVSYISEYCDTYCVVAVYPIAADVANAPPLNRIVSRHE